MSLNLGDEAMAACKTLANNSDFQTLLQVLGEKVQEKTNNSLTTAPDLRVDATAYARGLRDAWVAIEAARLGVDQNRVKKPTPKL